MKRGPLEIAVFSLSLLIILATIGLFIYDGLIRVEQPPTISINVMREDIRRTPTGFEVPLVLENNGDMAAQDVRVRVVSETETGIRQTSEVEVPFVPEGSTRDAVAVFPDEPVSETIEAHAVSYILP